MTDPRWSAPLAVALAVASVAACFTAGYRVAAVIYDRLSTKETS